MKKHAIDICSGKTCSEKFSLYIYKRLLADMDFYKYPSIFSIHKTSCMGNCQTSVNIKIDNELYSFQSPVKSSEILSKKIQKWKTLQNKNN